MDRSNDVLRNVDAIIGSIGAFYCPGSKKAGTILVDGAGREYEVQKTGSLKRIKKRKT